MDREKIVALGEFINKSLFDGSAKTNPAFDEGVILFTQQALALMKEQEAVEPEVDYICGNIVNVCGKCKSNLIARVKFCPWCGQAVKWK